MLGLTYAERKFPILDAASSTIPRPRTKRDEQLEYFQWYVDDIRRRKHLPVSMLATICGVSLETFRKAMRGKFTRSNWWKVATHLLTYLDRADLLPVLEPKRKLGLETEHRYPYVTLTNV